jgi:hypothetical protein
MTRYVIAFCLTIASGVILKRRGNGNDLYYKVERTVIINVNILLTYIGNYTTPGT